ncbi:MAG: trigger factor [Algisphaera sp.]
MAEDAKTEEDARPEQTVTMEDAGPGLKRLVIEIPEARIKSKIEESFGTLSDDAVLPGFRKGRAPRRLLEKRFASSVRDDVRSQLLSESYTQAIEDNDLDVIGEPDVKDIEKLELPESGSMKYSVEVEVTPEFELPAFDKLKAESKLEDVNDKDIDAEIEELRERNGAMTAVEDATVGEGDYVESNVKILLGKDAGDDAEVAFEQQGAYTLVHGKDKEFKGHVAGILIGDLGKQLLKKKTGETLSISMDGPDGHENEQIKGSPITIKLAITKVHRLEPASLEDLLPRFGMENEEELKERVRTMVEQRNEQTQQAENHKQITEQLVEGTTLELPEGLKGRQIERALQRERMQMLYQGVSTEEVEAKLAETRSEGEEAAVRQLKTFFVLDKAAKQLEVEVQENEINGRIAMMAMQQQRRPEKLRSEMRNRGELEQLYLSIREQKTLDAIYNIIHPLVVEDEKSDDA